MVQPDANRAPDGSFEHHPIRPVMDHVWQRHHEWRFMGCCQPLAAEYIARLRKKATTAHAKAQETFHNTDVEITEWVLPSVLRMFHHWILAPLFGLIVYVASIAHILLLKLGTTALTVSRLNGLLQVSMVEASTCVSLQSIRADGHTLTLL